MFHIKVHTKGFHQIYQTRYLAIPLFDFEFRYEGVFKVNFKILNGNTFIFYSIL